MLSNRRLDQRIVWRARHCSWQAQPPVPLRELLFSPGSLTAFLQRRIVGFGFSVLQQRWCQPLPDERRLLRLRQGEMAWIRESCFYSQDVPVIYARSIFPPQVARRWGGVLSIRTKRPIGEGHIFLSSEITRHPLQVAQITQENNLHCLASTAMQTTDPLLFARRSLFSNQAQAEFLVAEVFRCIV